MAARALTIKDQADFLRSLVTRTRLRDGATSAETLIVLSPDDAEAFDMLAMRLERMAPFETQIKRMVTGK